MIYAQASNKFRFISGVAGNQFFQVRIYRVFVSKNTFREDEL